METLLPLLTILFAEGYKWSVKRLGKEVTTISIYVGVFLLSFLWTYLQNPDIFSGEFGKQLFIYASASIATYDFAIKYLLKKQVMGKLIK